MNRMQLFILVLAQLVFAACDTQKTGIRSNQQFNEKINTEVKLGLHIVPVTINNKTYRFLFDTGAPTSISKELQKQLQYKVVDKGRMTDSDKNQFKVSYVRVDSLDVGEVTFTKVKAFVGDFTANPTLACLKLDGIIGSNMMRICNWEIDYQAETIRLSNKPFLMNETDGLAVNFRTDDQYKLLVDLKMGRAKVSNLKIDYGNNSSISVPLKVFKVLADEKILSKSFKEEGFSQSGIVGKPLPMTRYHGYLDSLQIGNLLSQDLVIKTGKSGLIGHDFLSRYIVAINWNEKKLRFKAHDSWEDSRLTFGYSIGVNSKGETKIFGVIEDSEAEMKNLKTGMRVLRIDSINFTGEGNFCDFIDYRELNKDRMYMELLDEEGKILKATLSRALLQAESL